MTIIRKTAILKDIGSDDAFPGEFEVVLSAPTEDRDGDTLLPDEWKLPLPEHITFDSDHGMSVATTVGSGTPELNEAGELIVRGTYSSLPRAQEVRTLVKEGHIRTTSVAFMTLKNSKAAGGKAQRELLNGAFVAVPSNREALVLSSKSLKTGARNSKSDQDLIQAILDAAIALGGAADTAAEKAAPAPVLKALAGSVEILQQRAREALQETYPEGWVWLRGTIPDGNGGGTVVFEVEDRDTYATELYQQSYTDDGTTFTLTGARAAVDVMEVIAPEPEKSGDSTSTDGAAAEPGAGAPAPAPGSKAAPTDEEAAAEIQVRAARIRARLHATTTSEGI